MHSVVYQVLEGENNVIELALLGWQMRYLAEYNRMD